VLPEDNLLENMSHFEMLLLFNNLIA